MTGKLMTGMLLATVVASSMADEIGRVPFLALDDASVTHPWKRTELRSSWKAEGGSFVRPLVPITQGELDFRTVFTLTNGEPVTVEFLGPDRKAVRSAKVTGVGRVPHRTTFEVEKPVAYLKVTPSRPAAAWDVMRSPLRVAVDYAMFETFDLDEKGLPRGWTGEGAAVTGHLPSAYAGDSKGADCDPFLTIAPGRRATAEFRPDGGRYAVSFQLFCHRGSVLWVKLPDGRRVSFRGADFVFSEEPRLRYLASESVWYDVRFEIDPAAGRTVVKLNGRELGVLSGAGGNDGRMEFANTGTIAACIDDVKVRALPRFADGVPEPKVPRDSRGNTVGINVCSLWHEGSHLGWDCVARCDDPEPVLGFYDEGENESADWEIKYMVEHGIDFQAFCWYAETWTAPIKHPSLAYQLDEGFKNAKWSSKMGYCLIWECANAAIPFNADVWRQYYVPYFIEHHFKDPRYQKIRNRLPLYIFGGSTKLAKQFGGIDRMRAEFDYLEARVRELGYDGMIYVMSNERSCDAAAKMGYDATAAYNWGGEGWRYEVNVAGNEGNAKDRSCFTIPTASVGFNNEPWGGSRRPMMSPEDFRKTLAWMRDSFGPATAAKGTWQENLYMISTWNEYGEGTYVMPTRDARGFGYLDAVRETFTDERSDPSLNLVPTERQRSRINRLFRFEREGVWDTPEKLRAWTKGVHQIASADVRDGTLRVTCSGSDGHLYSDGFSLKAKATQAVVIRARGKIGGTGELFWMQPGKRPVQKCSASFRWIGDGEWHDYRVRPFWQGERTVGRLRLDFPPDAAAGAEFEIASIRIEEPFRSAEIFAEGLSGLAFEARSGTELGGVFEWANGRDSGRFRKRFRCAGDGREHTCRIDLAGTKGWRGMVVWTNLSAEAGMQVRNLRWIGNDVDFPADIVVESARAEDAFNRVGSAVPVRLLLRNSGTVDAPDVSVTVPDLPSGMRLTNAAALSSFGEICGGDARTCIAEFACEAPGDFTVAFRIAAPGVKPFEVKVPVKVLPSLGLPRADYVPEPRPAKTAYDIAALYFPGWENVRAWERVWNRCPERKPVLGWYDEANPEVIDWQIKWLVENGIRTLYVDWYWHKGAQHHDHWVKSFCRTRYRRHLKWALMWANHTPEGSHSEEDQRAVTRFWIDNYFKTPEYLRIDGKPVVWIWQAENMNRDLGAGGCRRLLELSRRMAVEAGLKGIHFIAMKWPEEDCSPVTVRKCKDMGFDMTGIYHFMGHGGKATSGVRYPYGLVADANPDNWRRQHEANVLPFLPNLSTGWDDRPWNDQCEIYGKNAADFRRICVAAKRFADETGNRRLCLAPLNEWGEGSYAEPNAEHGFGFYEAVRETFCEKPKDGWPLNFGPKDVGLGPYDLPPPEPPKKVTAWDFTDGGRHGWRTLMGLRDVKGTKDGLTFRSATRDPALTVGFVPLRAKAFKEVVVRMKVEGEGGNAQLFWCAPGADACESSSMTLPLKADGAFHDYRFPVAESPMWRGRVSLFRFDPGAAPDVGFVLESVRLR